MNYLHLFILSLILSFNSFSVLTHGESNSDSGEVAHALGNPQLPFCTHLKDIMSKGEQCQVKGVHGYEETYSKKDTFQGTYRYFELWGNRNIESVSADQIIHFQQPI